MILFKKAIRSMLRHKKAYISCIVLMALGVWTYATMNTALFEIEKGKDGYYNEQRLGDAFASVAQIPKTALPYLEAIEGIAQVDGRVVETFRVIMPDHPDDVIKLKTISTIMDTNNRRLNAYVREGNDLGSIEDILIGHDFYQAYEFEPGDRVTLIIRQRTYDFTVQGSIYSPEYVYIVENLNEFFSDTTKYNIAYMDEVALMSLLGMEGLYNDLSFSFEEGYEYDDVKNELEHALKKYGLIELYERDDLFSYLMLEEEISSGRSMSTTFPMTFVAMAAVVLYLMLKRIIEQDRTQIGTLKAFGYANTTILYHYIFYGFVTGLIGTIVGILISMASIGPYIQFYLDYYKMPIGTVVTDYRYYYVGGFMSIIGGSVGAYFGAKNVVKLKPAEAMRPKAPRPIKKDITQMLPFLKHILNSRGFMAVRNITRNKIRSGFVVLGIVFSYSMMVMIGMMNGFVDMMFYNQFTHVLKYDGEIVLNESVPYAQGVQSAMAMEQVDYVEGLLTLPVMISNGFKKSGTHLVGIKEGNYLYKLYDDERHINLKLNKDGVILGSILAKNLEVKKGDRVLISSPYLSQDQELYVTEVVSQSIGSSAYMDLSLLGELTGQDMKLNSLIVQSGDMDGIRKELLYSGSVSKVESKDKTLELYETMLGSYDFMIVVLQFIAIIIGFTIIYNTAVISLSERSREYATLRVLGLHIKEVKEIMSFEYWILCFVGIILGIPFARVLNQGLINAIEVDAFAWPSKIPTSAFLIGAAGCMLAVAFANLTSVKAIKKLDLVEVLKERE
ncbi:MAG: hypothetical protein CVU95_04295 [Firmicutes bacterium HGW-Firmicutes-2]|nr:MAG: hypothetical protein CVU95_04295 [Firmicutes bacterium HGW-Firmicutes-2]